MKLWWFLSSSSKCRYLELKDRGCLALGWPELGSLTKYVRDKPGWERQFKTFVQLKGNIAYANDKVWQKEGHNLMTGVPDIFWRFLHIKEGDLVVVMETGSQLTLGQIEVMGIARVTKNAMVSYLYNDQYHHAHQICDGLVWRDWNRAKFGELEKPKASFNTFTDDNSQIDRVIEALAI